MISLDLKKIFAGIGIAPDDKSYLKHFESVIGPEIYLKHAADFSVFCVFCSHLQRSSCHEYCFSCTKGTYKECSLLLPGTFSFTDSYFDALDEEFMPWIFKTPCTHFERLMPDKYFRNFLSVDHSITIACYEALEGIFFGISRGKRPCHICASVCLDIYNICTQTGKTTEDSPCDRIIAEISSQYRASSEMVRYED